MIRWLVVVVFCLSAGVVFAAPVDFGGKPVEVEVIFDNTYIGCDRLVQGVLREFVRRHHGLVIRDSFNGYREKTAPVAAVFTVSRIERRHQIGDFFARQLFRSAEVDVDWEVAEIQVLLEIYQYNLMTQAPLRGRGTSREIRYLNLSTVLGSWSRYLGTRWSEYSDERKAEFSAFVQALDNLAKERFEPGFGKMIGVAAVLGEDVILNVGARDDVKVGDIYAILGPALRDPYSGELLDSSSKAVVRVITIKEKTCIAQVIRGDLSAIKRGDQAKKSPEAHAGK